MNILRNVLAVIAGYIIFGASAVLLFQLAGIDPHGDMSTGGMVLTVIYGMFFACMGGYVTQWISKSTTVIPNYVLAGLIIGFAAFSMVKTTGNHYSQIAAIFVFAPMSVLGGLWYQRRTRRN